MKLTAVVLGCTKNTAARRLAVNFDTNFRDSGGIDRGVGRARENQTLIIALARYVGLRTPSEPFALKWSDMEWSKSRLRVWSPKTEHHAGKDHRWVPLLPEVRPCLEEVFEACLEGAEYVFQRLIDHYPSRRAGWQAMNLHTTFEKIILKAGCQPWHNLRASAQTDLARRFPRHVCCQWLGNSQAVAQKDYLGVTDEHFQAAIGDEKATRNTARLVRQTGCLDAHQEAPKKTPCFSGVSPQGMPPVGLEPTTNRLRVCCSTN